MSDERKFEQTLDFVLIFFNDLFGKQANNQPNVVLPVSQGRCPPAIKMQLIRKRQWDDSKATL